MPGTISVAEVNWGVQTSARSALMPDVTVPSFVEVHGVSPKA